MMVRMELTRAQVMLLNVTRVVLGAYWLKAAWPKLTNPAWTSGAAVLKNWQGGLGIGNGGHPAIALEWYRAFIEFLLAHHAQAVFARLVMAGELTVGVCLVLGMLTPVAAAGGAFLNLNYMLAGSAGTNPILYTACWAVLLTWRLSARFGADWWLLDLRARCPAPAMAKAGTPSIPAPGATDWPLDLPAGRPAPAMAKAGTPSIPAPSSALAPDFRPAQASTHRGY